MSSSADSTFERSQRTHSSTVLSSASFSITPVRPRSKSISLASDAKETRYSERGFELKKDPFALFDKSSTFVNCGLGPISQRRRRTTGSGSSKLDCFVDDHDEAIIRLGACASRFGARSDEANRRWADPADETDDDSTDEDEDERSHAHAFVEERGTGLSTRQRTQSSLCVFHDAFEQEEEAVQGASTSVFATSDHEDRTEDIDTAAQSVLASQDKWGLFALIESMIEWPLTPSPDAHTPPTPALSRSSSAISLSIPPTPFDSPRRTEIELEPTSSGELWEYYRQKSEANLKALAEEAENIKGGSMDEQDEEGTGPVALKGIVDVLTGMGTFI